MRIHIGQINPTVGALSTNAELIRRAYDDGVRSGAEIVMVPELAVTGYPPRDLLDRDVFVTASFEVRDALAAMTGEVPLIFGCITKSERWCGKPLHNSAIVAQNGTIVQQQHKALLPTYDVFDELRYFEPGRGSAAIALAGHRVGVTICEDFWFDDEIFGTKLYCHNPVDDLARQNVELILNISASPFNAGKRRSRYDIFSRIAERYRVPLVYVNQVGGNELWRNLGGGKFENITASAGVSVPGKISVSASFADIDNDGDVDLYVTTVRYDGITHDFMMLNPLSKTHATRAAVAQAIGVLRDALHSA